MTSRKSQCCHDSTVAMGPHLGISSVELWIRDFMSQKIHGVHELKYVKSIKARNPHVGMVWELESEVPAQMSSLSLDCGSKLPFVHQ
ncbi:hypothetical protein TNCV_3393671 [Trichonephila clavipes]|nr:hypothetical protein TNCV_3393671 [Trichonephila clavipes]